MIKEAMLFRKEKDLKTTCFLCQHRCLVAPSKYGICGVRQNTEGTLFSHVYGEVIASHVDPIEKKPLFHFLPGSPLLFYRYSWMQFQVSFLPELADFPKDKKRRGLFI